MIQIQMIQTASVLGILIMIFVFVIGIFDIRVCLELRDSNFDSCNAGAANPALWA
jgi:hypothetical protein